LYQGDIFAKCPRDTNEVELKISSKEPGDREAAELHLGIICLIKSLEDEHVPDR
jgi:hypothetical protein